MAPAPEPILERLHTLAAESLKDPTTRGQLQGLGFTVVASSRAGIVEAILGETERWRRVIEEAHRGGVTATSPPRYPQPGGGGGAPPIPRRMART